MQVGKRLAIGLAAAMLVTAMADGVATADPSPDSAAGTCGGDVTVGPGGEIGQLFVPTLKTLTEVAGNPLGQQIRTENEGEPGFAIPLACAPGHQP